MYVDGVRSTADIVNISAEQAVVAPQSPPTLVEKHSWGDEAFFPSFETPGAIDVTAAPFSAKGDGVADDADAINTALESRAARSGVVWLPKGVYRLSKPLLVPQGVALVGCTERSAETRGHLR